MTIRATSRKFTALDILNRASEYGMVVSLVGDNLAVDIPFALDQDKKDRALEVIKTHKPEIVAYLHGLTTPTVCYTCLDMDKETPSRGEYKGIMYCAEHMPALEADDPLDNPVVQEVSRLFGAQIIEIMPGAEWTDEYKTRLLQQCRRSMVKPLQRAPIQQRLIDQWVEQGEDFTGLDWMQGDYWTGLEERLARKGYDQAFKTTEQALFHRVQTPRVYASPVPCYEMREDDHGGMRLVAVGYWNEQSQEVVST